MRSCAPAEVSALRMRLADEAYARFHPDVVAARVIALYERLGMPARTAA